MKRRFLRKALPEVMRIVRQIGMDLCGTIVSLDGVYDCRANRRAIDIFKERFRTIERVFAREDKFRRLLLRFERISGVHYAFKTHACTMIDLRHYCKI
jgi:hypothetical protein